MDTLLSGPAQRSSHGQAVDGIRRSMLFSELATMFLHFQKDVLNVCGVPARGTKKSCGDSTHSFCWNQVASRDCAVLSKGDGKTLKPCPRFQRSNEWIIKCCQPKLATEVVDTYGSLFEFSTISVRYRTWYNSLFLGKNGRPRNVPAHFFCFIRPPFFEMRLVQLCLFLMLP